jgi:hypothetical protein
MLGLDWAYGFDDIRGISSKRKSFPFFNEPILRLNTGKVFDFYQIII